MAPVKSVALLGMLLFAGYTPASAQTVYSSLTADMSPIRKVVTLIEEMKTQCEKDAQADLTAYDKYMCWCGTNEKAKDQAIADAGMQIEELTAFLEESAATSGELKTEIAQLEEDIAADQDALATATALREKENKAFIAEEADLSETIQLLKEAVEVLDKVNLLQRAGQRPSRQLAAKAQQASEALIQLHRSRGLRGRFPQFASVMQRDLFDMLGALPAQDSAFLPRRKAASFQQQQLLPWEKTEEQIGTEAKPNELEGAAAGAKSYNARSGRIFGLLNEMSDETKRDLEEATKTEATAEDLYQKLKVAKEGEIAAATASKKAKEAELADLGNKMAKAERDLEATKAALDADQTFLTNMKEDCKIEDEEYKKRDEIRSTEIVALAETLKILNEDDARDLFGKTISLLQVSASASERARALMQDHAAERAMQRIAGVAKRHRNWSLVSLAVRVRLDEFAKVKEMMDKMLLELQKQQKDDYEKFETCKKDIDETEDTIKVKNNVKADLAETHQDLVNQLETLATAIAHLQKEEADMEISLKQAGEERKEQNQVYQQSVMDQRAAVNVLNKALTRLKTFYLPGNQTVALDQQPGQAVAPAPAKGQAYQKSAGAGGVVQLLMKVIEEAEIEEKQLEMGEQRAQEAYGTFVKDATANIEADRQAIEEKKAASASAETEKSETEEAQLANGLELEGLGGLLKAHHLDCDYIVKYFSIRQQARQEEMDSITDAKAILSGADFGR